MLRLNLFNIVISWNLKVIDGGYPTEIRTIWNIFKLRLLESTLKETDLLWFQLPVTPPNIITSILYINAFVLSWWTGYK